MIDDLNKKIDKETPKVENEVLELVENKLNEFFKISVMKFYNDYPNPIYERRDSLYNIFVTKRNGKKLDFEFNPLALPPREGTDAKYGTDFLYETIFKEGWHGGARHDGKMLYRKPVPYYRYWGKEAVKSHFSPYEMFIAIKEDYEKRGFKNDYKNIWVKHLNNIGLKVK